MVVDIDLLSFENHICNLCKKAAKQLNVLKRIGKKKPQETNCLYFIHLFYPILTFARHFCSDGNTKRWKKSKNELFDLFIKILAVLMKISYKKNWFSKLTHSKNENYGHRGF